MSLPPHTRQTQYIVLQAMANYATAPYAQSGVWCNTAMHPARQAPKSCAGATRPPRQSTKTVGDRLTKSAFLCPKMPFRLLRVAKGSFGKPFLVQIGSTLAACGCFIALEVPKPARRTQRSQTEMRQNRLKTGFGCILDRFRAIPVHSRSVS